MKDALLVLFGWIAFGGTHIFLSHGRIRQGLLGRLGERGYSGLYSLVALATFYFLATAYFGHRHAGPELWDLRFYLPAVRLVEGLVYVAFFFMGAGLLAPSPLSMIGRAGYGPRGLMRITRHPFTMGSALLGVAHCIVNGFPSDLAFFGGLAAFSIAGAFHQDARKRRAAKPEQISFFEQTSVIPFAAVMSGRQKLKLREIPWIQGLTGVAGAIVIRMYHDNWWGIPVL